MKFRIILYKGEKVLAATTWEGDQEGALKYTHQLFRIQRNSNGVTTAEVVDETAGTPNVLLHLPDKLPDQVSMS